MPSVRAYPRRRLVGPRLALVVRDRFRVCFGTVGGGVVLSDPRRGNEGGRVGGVSLEITLKNKKVVPNKIFLVFLQKHLTTK